MTDIFNRIQEETYIFESDSGHAWLAVKAPFLHALGVWDSISKFSYFNFMSQTAYLEEDIDAGVFIRAYKERFGENPKIKETYVNNLSNIRNYDSIAWYGLAQ